MALKHSFEKKGNLFFRYRGQIPLVLFAAAIPALYFSPIQDFIYSSKAYYALLASGVFCSLFGFIWRALAIGKSYKQTSGRNTWGHEAEQLNTKGVYSMIRHPLYLGNFFMWMGIVVFTGNPWFVIIVSLLFWFYYERIAFSEEQFLEQKFGKVFLDWSENVPAFVPKFSKFEASSVPFSIKTILRREYPGISACVIGFVFVDFVRVWILFGQPLWLISHGAAVLAALLYSLTMRSLKHHTKLLWEEDRS